MSQDGLIQTDARTAGRSCQSTGSVQLETQWSVLHVVSQGGFWFMCFTGGETSLSLFPAPARSICSIMLFFEHINATKLDHLGV